MMRIAATAALTGGKDSVILYQGPFEETLPLIKEDCFDGVELHLADSRAIDRPALERLLKELNLPLTSIGTGSAYGLYGYSLVHQDADIRRRTIAHLEEHMITLAPWGGVIIIGLIAGRASECGAPLPVQKERLAESLRTLDSLAGRYGVSVGLELINRYEAEFLYTIREGIAYLKEAGDLPHTSLHIDSATLNIEESDIGAAIRAGKGWIGHVHLADNDRWYPGHAHYDFRETLQALKEIGYDGVLALEEKPRPDTRTAARLSLQYLRAVEAVLH